MNYAALSSLSLSVPNYNDQASLASTVQSPILPELKSTIRLLVDYKEFTFELDCPFLPFKVWTEGLGHTNNDSVVPVINSKESASLDARPSLEHLDLISGSCVFAWRHFGVIVEKIAYDSETNILYVIIPCDQGCYASTSKVRYATARIVDSWISQESLIKSGVKKVRTNIGEFTLAELKEVKDYFFLDVLP